MTASGINTGENVDPKDSVVVIPFPAIKAGPVAPPAHRGNLHRAGQLSPRRRHARLRPQPRPRAQRRRASLRLVRHRQRHARHRQPTARRPHPPHLLGRPPRARRRPHQSQTPREPTLKPSVPCDPCALVLTLAFHPRLQQPHDHRPSTVALSHVLARQPRVRHARPRDPVLLLQIPPHHALRMILALAVPRELQKPRRFHSPIHPVDFVHGPNRRAGTFHLHPPRRRPAAHRTPPPASGPSPPPSTSAPVPPAASAPQTPSPPAPQS